MSQSLSTWLLEKKIPSLSPETNKLMLEIAEALTKALEQETDWNVKSLATSYGRALVLVCVTSVEHQKLVIGEFERLVTELKAGE